MALDPQRALARKSAIQLSEEDLVLFRMIYDDKLAEAAYLIGCQRTGEAIVIDPERDIDRYERIAAGEGLRIVAVAETHIHADFLSGAREFAEKGAKVYVSDEGDADWKYHWLDKKSSGGTYQHQLLKHGDVFRVGGIEFKVVHTPGHTPEHICFLVTDRGGGASEPMGIATGDFIFVGDLGRPDLLETAAGMSGAAAPSARRLYHSVQAFKELPDYLQVWPAHGAGSACGKALGAVPQTTVGYEKRFNTAIKEASTESGFVQFILEGQPEPPLYFARMKRDNKMGPPVLGGIPKPARLTPADLLKLNAATSAIVDTRTWNAYRAGHVPGSLFHPVNKSFTTDVGSMIREGEPIYLTIDPAMLDEAVRDLIRIGLDSIKGWLDPADLEEYSKIGGALASMPEISVEEAMKLQGDRRPFILDVRRASEYAEGHIPGALNIAHTRLDAQLSDVPKSREILVHCRSGGRSARAAALLEKHGYTVVNLAGGMLAWEKAGGPVER